MSMTTYKFNCVEQFIEFMSGSIDINGYGYSIFDETEPPISLSRNDKRVIESLCHQTLNLSLSYTDRQAELAKKLIQKYRRQIENLGLTVPDVLDNYRLGIRQIDRTKKAWIENDKIILKFPFDTKIIDLIRREQQISQGQITFKTDTKTWELSLTEYSVNFVMAGAEIHNFEVSDDLKNIFQEILRVEKSNYTIELVEDSDCITIRNAEKSLIDYLVQQGISLERSDCLSLIDYSQVLGYGVCHDLVNQTLKTESTLMKNLILNRRCKIDNDDSNIQTVLEYARQFNRTPVYCYSKLINFSESDDLIVLNNKTSLNVKPKLLITDSEFMIGSKRQAWLMNSEKVVFLNSKV